MAFVPLDKHNTGYIKRTRRSRSPHTLGFFCWGSSIRRRLFSPKCQEPQPPPVERREQAFTAENPPRGRPREFSDEDGKEYDISANNANGDRETSTEPPGSALYPRPDRLRLANLLPSEFVKAGSDDLQDRPRVRLLNESLPLYLPCRIQIMVNGRRWEHSQVFDIGWLVGDQYVQCVKLAEEYLSAALVEVGQPPHAFYQVSQQFRIFNSLDSIVPISPANTLSSIIEASNSKDTDAQRRGYGHINCEGPPTYAEDVPNVKAWAEKAWAERVPPSLAKELLRDRESIFGLEIKLSYTVFRQHSESGCEDHSSCISRIQKDLGDQQVALWDEDKQRETGWFVPSKLTEAYFDKKTIEHLLHRYEPEWTTITDPISEQAYDEIRQTMGTNKNPPSFNDIRDQMLFWTYIENFGVRLLATTYYAGLDLRFMIRLWIAGFQNADIPLRIPTGIERKDFQAYQKYEPNFSAHNFPDSYSPEGRYKTEKIEEETIIPILYKEHIGYGANANVYKVRVHENHHNFTPDRNEWMALKVLKRDDPQGENAQAESSVLQAMANAPHEHLTPFYASWSHKNSFQMLFPLAEMNLETYLMEKATPELNNDTTLWLINQMGGLAAALDQIHSLQPPGQDLGHTIRNNTHLPRTGVHLDLSLRNILIFAGDVMKICDFGSARIQQIRSADASASTCNFVGNQTYAAPDESLYGKVSRPYDIFSLGCIFLEILLWASPEKSDPKTFSEERVWDISQPKESTSSAFFEVDGPKHQQKARLKNIVEQKFTSLETWIQHDLVAKQHHPHAKVFETLLDLIKMMMRTDKNARPLAAQVRSWFDYLSMQVKAVNAWPSPNNPKVTLSSTIGEYRVNSSRSRRDTNVSRAEERLSPPSPAHRSRTNSIASLDDRQHGLSEASQHLPRATASDIHAAISGIGGGQAGENLVSSQPPRITITTPDSETHQTELMAARLSVFQQELQSQARPIARERSDSDPRRVQTV